MKKQPLLLLLLILAIPALSQDKISSEFVIDKFLEAIGGRDRMLNLQTRVEKTKLSNYGGQGGVFNGDPKITSQTIYYQTPDLFLEHSFSTKGNYHTETVLFKREKCSWYYRSNEQAILFFDPEPIKFEKDFPRTYFLEPFNLKAEKYAFEEDGMYRIDFRDHRQDGGYQSVYIDKETFLPTKRTYVTASTMTRWTFIYEDYQTIEGFTEPRTISLFGGGELFMTIEIEEISYNVNLNDRLFEAPVPCLSGESIPLEVPYYLPKAVVEEN